MSIRFREAGNITVVDIEGNVDINSSDIIETVGYFLNTGKTHFIVNMESVNLVDYSGLSVLAITYKNVANHKGKMKFVRVSPQTVELFKLVKLDNVFEVYPDEESAIKSFCEPGADTAHLRRRFKRLDLHLKVKFWIVGSQKRPKIFEGDILNMSAAGIYVFTKYTFPMNTQLELEINLPGDIRFLDASGRVMWLADKELQPHCFPGMGVAFSHLTSEKERIVIDYIDKNITHRAEGPA